MRRIGPVLGDGIRPGLSALRRRERPALTADLVAGVTVTAYLVPQVLAYAGFAGLAPVSGLRAALAPLSAYAVVGSSRLLSIGPESTTAIMTAIAIAPLAAGDSGRHAVLAAALAVLVGVLCLAGRVARLGFLAVSTAVPAVLTLLPVLLPRLPGPLLAVLLATAVSVAADLPGHGVAVVGAVPPGIPALAVPVVSVADLAALLLPALGVALVGYSDNVLTGRAFARDGRRVDADRELLALGTANIAAGFLQGFPVSSSGSRTAIGAAVGGHSQLASVVTALLVLAVLAVGGPVLAAFPSAALGALVVHAAVRLVDGRELRRFARFRRSELLIALATAAAVQTVGVLGGVLAAVGLSILDLLRRVSRPHNGVLGFVPGLAGMHDVDDHPGATTVPGLVVYRYDAPLCFANAKDFRTRATAAVDARPHARWLLLNMEAVVQIDVTAADALGGLCEDLRRRGVTVALARAKHELLGDLARSGLRERIGEDRIFPTLPTAVAAYRGARRAGGGPFGPPGRAHRPRHPPAPGR